ILCLLPDSLLRLLLWLATHTLYRLDVVGRENVPVRGGALLTPNHVSMADAAFLLASIDRPIRFLMFRGSYEHPLVKPFAKILGAFSTRCASRLDSHCRPPQRPRKYAALCRTSEQRLSSGAKSACTRCQKRLPTPRAGIPCGLPWPTGSGRNSTTFRRWLPL